jgi:IstB-like ATP binding protein
VPVLARKPGALRNGAPFKDWVLPAAIERARRKLAGAQDGNRQMVDILNAVLTDGLPAAEAACAEAIAHGVHSADVVLNILVRQRDPAPPANILTPAALTLRHAPITDCARYGNLRRTISWNVLKSSTSGVNLKLYGMKAAFDEIMATAVTRQHEPQPIVGDLLHAEMNEKQARSIKYQLTNAKLPLAKDLEDFQFLEIETRNGRQGRIAEHLTRMDFSPRRTRLPPFAQSGGQLLFHLQLALRAYLHRAHHQSGIR